MARDFDRQVAEVQIRIAFMHGYTALGMPTNGRGISPSRERGTLSISRFVQQSRFYANCAVKVDLTSVT